jgi:hypothetical protein
MVPKKRKCCTTCAVSAGSKKKPRHDRRAPYWDDDNNAPSVEFMAERCDELQLCAIDRHLDILKSGGKIESIYLNLYLEEYVDARGIKFLETFYELMSLLESHEYLRSVEFYCRDDLYVQALGNLVSKNNNIREVKLDASIDKLPQDVNCMPLFDVLHQANHGLCGLYLNCIIMDAQAACLLMDACDTHKELKCLGLSNVKISSGYSGDREYRRNEFFQKFKANKTLEYLVVSNLSGSLDSYYMQRNFLLSIFEHQRLKCVRLQNFYYGTCEQGMRIPPGRPWFVDLPSFFANRGVHHSTRNATLEVLVDGISRNRSIRILDMRRFYMPTSKMPGAWIERPGLPGAWIEQERLLKSAMDKNPVMQQFYHPCFIDDPFWGSLENLEKRKDWFYNWRPIKMLLYEL